MGIFFTDDGDTGFDIGGNMAVDQNGEPMFKIGDNFAVDSDGETHFTFGNNDQNNDFFSDK